MEENIENIVSITRSSMILENTMKINIYTSLFIFLIGIIGHSITIFLFSRKRFRLNSSHIYLFCIAVTDSLFLFVHFFEDTIRTSINVYSNENITNDFNLFIFSSIQVINIADNFDTPCKLINYFRYVLRFISAYIIVAFTLQRLIIVFKPSSYTFKSKKSAWYIVITITIFSFLLNAWVPTFFERNFNGEVFSCNLKATHKTQYFHMTVFYICLIMLIPILTIFISNSLIIFKTVQADLARKKLRAEDRKKRENLKESSNNTQQINIRKNTVTALSSSNNSKRSDKNYRMKPYYLNLNFSCKKMTNQSKNLNKITKTLLFISFSYAFLNLPYFVSWSVFFYETTFMFEIEPETKNYLFTALQISEILYMINYGIGFYINCLSGSIFRNLVKLAGKKN